MSRIVITGGNGLKFEGSEQFDRPHIQDLQDDEDDNFNVFQVYSDNGSFTIHKNDVDDVIELLKKVKEMGMRIDGISGTSV